MRTLRVYEVCKHYILHEFTILTRFPENYVFCYSTCTSCGCICVTKTQINTCNGYYCDGFKPNSNKKPIFWTEDWDGWYYLYLIWLVSCFKATSQPFIYCVVQKSASCTLAKLFTRVIILMMLRNCI